MPVSMTLSMRQRQDFRKWYCALCLCAIGLVLDHLAWAQAPNETYDFNITKGIVEFGRGHYAQAADLFKKARQAVPNDAEAAEYLDRHSCACNSTMKPKSSFTT